MCMEDVKIGRDTLSQNYPFTTGVAARPVLSGSDKRVALILGSPLAGTITYLDGSGVVSGLGFNVGAGQPPLILTIQDNGDIVRHQWWAIADAAARLHCVGETLLVGPNYGSQ